MSFVISPISGKGLGLVASEKIEPGALIIQEEPLVSLRLDESGDLRGNVDPSTGEFLCQQLEHQLGSLSKSKVGQFHELTDSFTRNGTISNFGIIKTNSFSICARGQACYDVEDEDAKTFLALFLQISRINHSCVPNCHHYWSNKKGSFLVRAAQVIEKGEEICISYMSPLQRSDFHERNRRRNILNSEFGFWCLCQLCTMEDHLENDKMRRQVLEIEEQWSDLGDRPELALELAERQLDHCEHLEFQAGLLAYVTLHCVEASSLLISTFMGTEMARELRIKCEKYAEKAKEYGLVAYGDKSEEFDIFQSLEKLAKTSDEKNMRIDIQACITRLRDIDS